LPTPADIFPAVWRAGFVGNDVDYSGKGVGTVKSCRRAVKNLDLLGKVKREILGNRDLAASRVIDTDPIEQDEQLVVADMALKYEIVVA
jgi:hypothetical protein